MPQLSIMNFSAKKDKYSNTKCHLMYQKTRTGIW